jgi:hypothetical protein
MTTETIKIEQTLHGYSDGHRLIKSSKRFSKEIEKILLLLSDMSGPSMIKGFEDYITGYPIDDTLYAISKTWYAKEMKRPGCVWTHTLIMNSVDLSRIDDLQSLLKLFKRPQYNNYEDMYDYQIDFRNNQFDTYYESELSINRFKYLTMKIIDGLYNHPDDTVYILSYNSREYQDLIMKIWNQQWPELRRVFSFCTGSISSRKANNKTLDLQVIPFKNENQIKREMPTGIYIDDTIENIDNIDMEWVSIAANNIFDEKAIRNLLWRFAENSNGGRREFSSYLKIITYLNEINSDNLPISNLTEKICTLFPSPNDAVSLKSTIYGNNKSNDYISAYMLSENLALRELSTTRHYLCFDPEKLNISERAKKLWKHNTIETEQLIENIISKNLNPLGEAFLSGISQVITSNELINIANSNVGLFYVVLSLNPSLASQVLRDGYIINFNYLLDAVAKSKNLTEFIKIELINSILNIHKDKVANDLLRAFGELSVYTFLDWLNNNLPSLSSYKDFYGEWKTVLSNNVRVVINWLSKNPKTNSYTLEYLYDILDPNSLNVINMGANIWMPLAELKRDDKSNIKIRSFLLALGFNNPHGGADKLVRMNFEEVYNAIGDDSIDYHSLYLIEKHMPSLSWWLNWDKRKRLSDAFVDKFIQYNWSPQEFLLSVNNMTTFSRIIQYCKFDNDRKKFIMDIRNKIAHGEISAKKSQIEIIDDHILE